MQGRTPLAKLGKRPLAFRRSGCRSQPGLFSSRAALPEAQRGQRVADLVDDRHAGGIDRGRRGGAPDGRRLRGGRPLADRRGAEEGHLVRGRAADVATIDGTGIETFVVRHGRSPLGDGTGRTRPLWVRRRPSR